MRPRQIQTIGAVAAGSAVVASVPIAREAVNDPEVVIAEISLLIPLCAAIGGGVAGLLLRPTLGMPDWTGLVTSAAFAVIALLIAAPVGGFLLVAVFIGEIGDPEPLQRLIHSFEGAMFAVFYLIELAPTVLGIAAIAGHVALVHLTARRARRYP